jgi:electron transfer flavoprotein alpha subunit
VVSLGIRVAVLIKQVPQFEALTLGADGRLVREGLPREINPFCRRAVAKGTELAQESGGECVVFTLGPPSAEDALREAIAWGADRGVLVSDPAFAGSDTLATAKALEAAIRSEGEFDLVLTGLNSVDADTGQVGPQLAELLGLPILAGVKEMAIEQRSVAARLEHDDGWVRVEVEMPALVSCAERLCEPAKVAADSWKDVPLSRIRRVTAASLGPGPWGQAGSPTAVGDAKVLTIDRQRRVLTGSIDEQVASAISILTDSGALLEKPGIADEDREIVSRSEGHSSRQIAVIVEPDRPGVAAELLGEAANIAASARGSVTAIVAEASNESLSELSGYGADAVIRVRGGFAADQLARELVGWAIETVPWALLSPGTLWGREVASRLAAALGAGLTGDAIDLVVDQDRLIGWKPAFGGSIVAAITSSSPTQIITVRPGVLPRRRPRPAVPTPVADLDVIGPSLVRLVDSHREDGLDKLLRSDVVIGVGAAVPPEEYRQIDLLRRVLDGELAATRKVTDRGWLARCRQIGITGRSIAPGLYVAVGLWGSFNHMVGVRSAKLILAINNDPAAAVFNVCDIGMVANWREAVPALVTALRQYLGTERSQIAAEPLA